MTLSMTENSKHFLIYDNKLEKFINASTWILKFVDTSQYRNPDILEVTIDIDRETHWKNIWDNANFQYDDHTLGNILVYIINSKSKKDVYLQNLMNIVVIPNIQHFEIETELIFFINNLDEKVYSQLLKVLNILPDEVFTDFPETCWELFGDQDNLNINPEELDNFWANKKFWNNETDK